MFSFRFQTYCAGRVQNFQHALLTVHLDLFPVAVLYRRVVLFHKYALQKEWEKDKD